VKRLSGAELGPRSPVCGLYQPSVGPRDSVSLFTCAGAVGSKVCCVTAAKPVRSRGQPVLANPSLLLSYNLRLHWDKVASCHFVMAVLEEAT